MRLGLICLLLVIITSFIAFVNANNNSTVYMANDPYFLEWFNKGSSLFNLSRYNESIESYDKAIEANPRFAAAWYGKGLALYYMGEYSRAIEAFNETLGIDPQNVDASIQKSLALSDMNKKVYCLLRKPEYLSGSCPCYEFSLASTKGDAPRSIVIKGRCQVTDIGDAEGWEVDETYGGPYSDWTFGDDAIFRVSPDYDDFYRCNDCMKEGDSSDWLSQ